MYAVASDAFLISYQVLSVDGIFFSMEQRGEEGRSVMRLGVENMEITITEHKTSHVNLFSLKKKNVCMGGTFKATTRFQESDIF